MKLINEKTALSNHVDAYLFLYERVCNIDEDHVRLRCSIIESLTDTIVIGTNMKVQNSDDSVVKLDERFKEAERCGVNLKSCTEGAIKSGL